MAKTVLIISKNGAEYSTESVMDWILHLGHTPTRLNGDDFERFVAETSALAIGSPSISLNGETLPLSYDAIWFRRWSDHSSVQNVIRQCDEYGNAALTRALASCISQDIKAFARFIYSLFSASRILTNASQTHTNKLINLTEARKLSLKTPRFIFTTSKSILTEFYDLCGQKVILKSVDYSFVYKSKEAVHASFTNLVTTQMLEDFPCSFYLTFFQEYIEKAYEVRTFILGKKIYSMAIFSQKDEQTKVDFRRYNFFEPNRTVPYRLPLAIEKKLLKLMRSLDLDTGSVDLIRGTDGNYYFLEVNPVGQYGMVSGTCNYNLDLEIANYLCI